MEEWWRWKEFHLSPTKRSLWDGYRIDVGIQESYLLPDDLGIHCVITFLRNRSRVYCNLEELRPFSVCQNKYGNLTEAPTTSRLCYYERICDFLNIVIGNSHHFVINFPSRFVLNWVEWINQEKLSSKAPPPPNPQFKKIHVHISLCWEAVPVDFTDTILLTELQFFIQFRYSGSALVSSLHVVWRSATFIFR